MKKTYTIIAGINGVGKTSLYEILKSDDRILLGERINIDEIVRKEGDWRDNLLQIKAAREAMRRIDNCIARGVCFHQETTLPGPTILRQVKKAKARDYKIRLFFVGVDDLEIAIERVHRRVEMGGHGLDDDIIRRRFEKMKKNVRDLMPHCDSVAFYDNTTRFHQIAYVKNQELVDCTSELPRWFAELLDEK